LRVFLDTNVLFSAFASRGLCAELFEIVLLDHELITGEAVLDELRRSLRDKMRLPAPRCAEIVQFLREAAAACVQASSPVSAHADREDAVALGEALAGQAQAFVTGDAAVQRARNIGGMKILSPRDFWEELNSRVK
jgi:uncharacterized protein